MVNYEVNKNNDSKNISNTDSDKDIEIAIIGAGIAGLYSACQLEQLGYKKITIFETTNRIGGRIQTHYYNPYTKALYSDMGAMRIPDSHVPVFDLIGFLNEHLPDEQNIKLQQYYYSSRNSKIYKNSEENLVDYPKIPEKCNSPYFYRGFEYPFQKEYLEQFQKDEKYYYLEIPESLGEDLKQFIIKCREVNENYHNLIFHDQKKKSLGDQITEALKDAVLGKTEKMKILVKKYDKYSVVQYLTEQSKKRGIPFDMDLYEKVYSQSNSREYGIIEQVLDDIQFDPTVKIWNDRGELNQMHHWYTPEGGMFKITEALYDILKKKTNISFVLNTRVEVVEKSTKTGKIILTVSSQYPLGVKEFKEFDKIIMALPTNQINNIQFFGLSINQGFYDSLRTFNNHNLCKVSLKFNNRFWEDQEIMKDGFSVIGGQLYTDLPSRWIVYPSYGYKQGAEKPGTLLSYNWDNDANHLTALSDDDKKNLVLRDLQIMYEKFAKPGFNIYHYFTGEYFCLTQIQNQGNGLANFYPGQFQNLQILNEGIENKIFFAGEHLSFHHGWIVGAINSAVVAVRKVTGNNNLGFLCKAKYKDYPNLNLPEIFNFGKQEADIKGQINVELKQNLLTKLGEMIQTWKNQHFKELQISNDEENKQSQQNDDNKETNSNKNLQADLLYSILEQEFSQDRVAIQHMRQIMESELNVLTGDFVEIYEELKDKILENLQFG